MGKVCVIIIETHKKCDMPQDGCYLPIHACTFFYICYVLHEQYFKRVIYAVRLAYSKASRYSG